MSRRWRSGRWVIRTCAAALALGVAAGLLSGCGDDDDGGAAVGGTGSGTETGVQVEQDDALADALRGLSGQRRTAPLAELTDFSWSSVYVFSEGATAEQVEEAVGQPVLDSERYYDAGNLLVFVSDGGGGARRVGAAGPAGRTRRPRVRGRGAPGAARIGHPCAAAAAGGLTACALAGA